MRSSKYWMTAGTGLSLILMAAAITGGCAAGRGGESPAASTSGGPRFTARPTAVREGQSVRITFTVDRRTDVAVAVANARGKVIRHLAAGALGPKAPAPLVGGKLEQSLLWDGLDDLGRPVPAGRYKVRVSLGLAPTFDRVLDWNPRALGTVHGLGVGPRGEVYVMHEEGRDRDDGIFKVFTPKGKYLRTILPRPASIPLARAKPLGEMVLAGGERFPTCMLPQYGRRIYQVPIVTAEGDLIITNCGSAGHVEGKRFRSLDAKQKIPRRLLRIAADGGAPQAGFLGPELGRNFDVGLLYLATGPEGTIYVSGGARRKKKGSSPQHGVWRVKWGAAEKPELFVGSATTAGAGAKGFKGPCGIAFDAKGNLYVADRGNHRVAVFSPERKLIGQLKVEWPRHIVVHPASGAVYATSGFRMQRLFKFDGLGSKKPSATYDLNSDWAILALDSRGKNPAIYAANVQSPREPGANWRCKVVIRLVDTGKELRLDRALSDWKRPHQPLLVGVDRERELVYGMWPYEGNFRIGGRTGRVELFGTLMNPKANGIYELTAGADGTVAVHVTGEIGRLDHNLKPLAFSGTGTYIVDFPREDCLRSYYAKDCCVAPNGDIYWIHERGGYRKPFRVSCINSDGTLKKDSIVVLDSASAAGVRVDREGCIYILEHVKPVGKPVPADFVGRIKVSGGDTHVQHYASLLKFKPAGGMVRMVNRGPAQRMQLKPGQVQFMVGNNRCNLIAEGLEWSHYGVSMLRSWHASSGCKCWTPRFDLDEYGRAFVPDQLRSRILVIDPAGNLVTTFGRYGNPDDRGGIRLADPRTVMVSREAAYVGDMTNQRIVRAKLTYRSTASCSVEVSGRTSEELSRAYAAQNRIAERRRMLRLRNAELRAAEVRAEALKLSPSLDKQLDWDGFIPRIAASSATALANTNDARAVLCTTAPREARAWPEAEARALLGKYMAEGNQQLKLAVAWGLWGGKCGEAGTGVLKAALKERSQLVRVTAAFVLLDRNDPSGLAELISGAMAENPAVYRMAETAMLKKTLKDAPGDPRAGLVEPRRSAVPRYPISEADVKALGGLLRATRKRVRRGRSYWFLRRTAILLLGLSNQPAAGQVLLTELREAKPTGNNLNRFVGGLGALRCRAAVPDLLFLLARGRRPNWRGGHGDRAEQFAAAALGRIGDPKSVQPMIALLDSKTPGTAAEALRSLTLLFGPRTPKDCRLLPKAAKLIDVKVGSLPEPTAGRAAWEAFWKVNSDKYVSGTDTGLRRKQK